MNSDRNYPERPIVGVGIVVLDGDRVLLVRRGKEPRNGLWSLPGGAQEVGETVFETAKREVQEETGLSVEVIGLLDVIDSIHHDDEGRVRIHYTLVDVDARGAGDPVAGDDAADAAWFDIDEIGVLDLWDETVRIIHLARDRAAGR
jgi:8-oxo-dGTP diphosphatase